MFEPITSSAIPESIVTQIKKLISDGALKSGDCLPGERILTSQLQVSRSSLRQAIKHLEAIGYVRTIPGKGTFVQNSSEKTGLLMESLVLSWAETNPKDINDLLEVRLIIEVESSELAAKRASQEDLAMIENALGESIKAYESRQIDDMVSANVTFHRTISQATGNNLILTLIDSISAALSNLTTMALRISGGLRDSIIEHENIYNAIAAGDSLKAQEEMRKHIQGVKTLLSHIPDYERRD